MSVFLILTHEKLNGKQFFLLSRPVVVSQIYQDLDVHVTFQDDGKPKSGKKSVLALRPVDDPENAKAKAFFADAY